MARQSFQTNITASGATLPVIFILATLAYLAFYFLKPVVATESSSYLFWQHLEEWISVEWAKKLINYLLYGFIGYLLVELNNTFSIIRVRTTIQTSIYFLLVAVCPFLQVFQAGNFVALLLLLALFCLFWGTQSDNPVTSVFSGMLFISIGSLLFPQILFLIPALYGGISGFRLLTGKTFFAGIVGLVTPYWFLAGHAFFYGQMEVFYAPFLELATFKPIDYSYLSIPVLASIGLLIVLSLIAIIHYFAYSFQDKIRTRSFLTFLTTIVLSLLLFIALQPQHAATLMQILLPAASLLIGHLFALTSSRIANFFFILTILMLLGLAGLNIWML